jgi:hypothetical protein
MVDVVDVEETVQRQIIHKYQQHRADVLVVMVLLTLAVVVEVEVPDQQHKVLADLVDLE